MGAIDGNAPTSNAGQVLADSAEANGADDPNGIISLARAQQAEMLALQKDMMIVQHEDKMNNILTTAASGLTESAGKTADNIAGKIGR